MSINKHHQEEIQNKNNIKKTQESALNSLLTAPAQVNKTLFTEFIVSPKKAWFHVNDKVVYEAIQVQEYGEMDSAKLGQDVEDQVKKFFYSETIFEFAEHQLCSGAQDSCFDNSPTAVYQPTFMTEGGLIRVDFLVRNDEGTYDLREVKSKSTIRKTTKGLPLKDDLLADLSFQRFVLAKTLGEKFSGRCHIVYINKDYRKNGELNHTELIKKEEVTDELMSMEKVEALHQSIGKDLALERDSFEKKYPYNNEDYLTYYGTKAPKGSIWEIPGIGYKKKKFVASGKTMIHDLESTDIALLRSSQGEPTKSKKYLELYRRGETVIDTVLLKEKLSSLRFPLYFYDYETISSPIPYYDGTGPSQQVVVQFSVHTIHENGTITHDEAILEENSKNNKSVIETMNQILNKKEGTYIVWYKGFENERNKETARMYPEYNEFFENINANTFDLMDIFKDLIYFDKRFHGSASIKKVLPVLTEISYDTLDVGNGAIATRILSDLLQGKYTPEESELKKAQLLEYCKQDTWAMVRIRQELMKHITPEETPLWSRISTKTKNIFLGLFRKNS